MPSRHASGCGGSHTAPGGTGGGSVHPDGGAGVGGSASGGSATGGGGADNDGGADAAADSGQDSPNDGTAVDASTWWKPGTGALPWQWELDHEISTASAADMGTGDMTYLGAGAADPVVYDIDGFDNTAADVGALHALGKKVICYIEVGAAESYRPDYAQFPAAALGKLVDNYPQEKYLDINGWQPWCRSSRRGSRCAPRRASMGWSPTSTTRTRTTPASRSPRPRTSPTSRDANGQDAHGLGLAWGLKNGGDGGDPSTFVAGVLPHVDFAVVEEPFHLMTIGDFQPAFDAAGKAMFVAEYTGPASAFCAKAIADHTNAALFDVALDGQVRDPCQ